MNEQKYYCHEMTLGKADTCCVIRDAENPGGRMVLASREIDFTHVGHVKCQIELANIQMQKTGMIVACNSGVSARF